MTQLALFAPAASAQGALPLPPPRRAVGTASLKSCRADARALVKRWGMQAHETGVGVTLYLGARWPDGYISGWHQSFGDWRQALQAVMRWQLAEAKGGRRPWETEAGEVGQ